MTERKARPISIAIDGPAAAGKSTTAREVARRLGILYIDSGAMYRALALKLSSHGVDPGDAGAVERQLPGMTIDLVDRDGGTRVILDGQDVTERLRDEKLGHIASIIAQQKAVRSFLVERQRQLANDRGVVMEGRDIGTIVLPGATVKIFLTASLDVRALRRRQELEERGQRAELAEVRKAIADRDRSDVERSESPLRPAPDAVEVDTSSLSIAGQVERVIEVVRSRLESADPPQSLQSPVHQPPPPQSPPPKSPPPQSPPPAPTTAGGSPAADIRGFYRFIRSLARVLARSLFRLRVEGLEHLPARGGFILAANHASFIDPPLAGLCATRRLGYLAKEELFTIPGFKHLIVALGAIPIHRRGLDRDALRTAKSVLAKGSGLLLFPEGTRTRNGSLGPARPGVSMLAAEMGVPVVPAHIRGSWRIGRRLFRRPPVGVRFGPPIPPPKAGKGPAWRAEIRDHAERIMQAIATLGGLEIGSPGPVTRRSAGLRSVR